MWTNRTMLINESLRNGLAVGKEHYIGDLGDHLLHIGICDAHIIYKSLFTSATVPIFCGMIMARVDELAHAEYWDERYKNLLNGEPHRSEDSATDNEKSVIDDNDESKKDLMTYDWFRGWDYLESWCRENLPPTSAHPKILHLGCGNSVCITIRMHCLEHPQN